MNSIEKEMVSVLTELLWRKNKRDFYGLVYAGDANRITMPDDRHENTMSKLGIVR